MSLVRNARATMIAAAVAATAMFTASSAHALLLNSWTNITNNGNTNVGGQLAVDVTAVGGTQVKFHFTNNVGIASSITQIYFDDKTVALLGSIASITDSGAGVAYSAGGSPGNLPGGNPVSFTADALVSPDSPTSPNGINSASEFLDVTFNLAAGLTFADVLAQLGSGDLVIGMHIQSIAPQGGSDSYINGIPTTQVPEPAALSILAMGLLGLGLAVRRRRR